MSAVLAPARAAAPVPATVAQPVTQVRVIRSEATKLRALRSTWACALTAVILIVGVGALVAGGKPYRVSAAHPAVTAVSTSLFGILLAQLVLGVLGVLVFSGEYGTGMIRATLAVVPARLPVLWAKLLVLAALVLPVALLATLAEFFVATAIQSARGGSGISLTDPGVLRTLVGAALYLSVAALVGLALGALLRKTAAGISVVRRAVPHRADRRGAPPARHRGHRPLPAVQRRRSPVGPAAGHPSARPVDRIRGALRVCGAADRPGRLAAAAPRRVSRVRCEDASVSFWKPVEDPGTRTLRSWAFDIGCAAIAFAASLAHFSFGQTAHAASLPLAASLGVAALAVLALPLRRVWPGPVFGYTLLAAAILAVWPTHGALFPVALAIALYTVAATMRRREALAAAVLMAGLMVAVVGHDGTRDWVLAVSDAAGFAAAVLIVGLYVNTRRAYLAALRDRASRMERERDQNNALAAALERARIAREMHDSVAHHLTVIVALSDGALAAVARAPAEASEAIRDVSRTAREALTETRRMFAVLRAGSGPELWQPLPGLADLDGLLGTVRAAGLPVRYERGGSAGDLPPACSWPCSGWSRRP